jgi:hypothetical protein
VVEAEPVDLVRAREATRLVLGLQNAKALLRGSERESGSQAGYSGSENDDARAFGSLHDDLSLADCLACAESLTGDAAVNRAGLDRMECPAPRS